METSKLEAVKEFLYKLFVFKPDSDLGPIGNKQPEAPSFADYRQNGKELAEND
jgi:hypothetical protein